MVCTANISNVKTSFLLCTVSHCTSAALPLHFGHLVAVSLLGGGWGEHFILCDNYELEVHASKPAWCAL